MADGKVVFQVTADSSSFESDLNRVTQTIESKTASWKQAGLDAASALGTGFSGLIGMLSELGDAFAKFAVQFLTDGIEMAASIKEIDGTISSVFGSEGAAKIDEWSRTLVSKLGLSELQAKKYAASVGVIAKQTGLADDEMASFSQDVTAFAADLASFIPGMSTDTAFNAILKAFQGKGTTLGNYGIDLTAAEMKTYAESQGVKWSELSEIEQFNMRYEKMFADMKNLGALGAFAESRGSQNYADAVFAGTYANVASAVGKPIEGMISSAKNVLADLLNAVMGVEQPITGTVEEWEAYRDQMAEALPVLKQLSDEAVAEIGAKYGMNPEDFVANGLYGSYTEWVTAALGERMKWEKGENYDELRTVLPMLSELSSTLVAVEGEVNNANDAIKELGARDAAAELEAKAEAEMQAYINGITSKYGALSAAISQANAYMAQLGNHPQSYGGTYTYTPSHASGLDYVPYDNYRASLHAGESVLTAQEAKVWRSMKYGISQPSGVNYDALGSTMRENVKAGGNVYLDGQAVGRVISARQADSYRAMERSGFQQ